MGVPTLQAPVSCNVSENDGDVAVSWMRADQDGGDGFVLRRSRDGGQFWWAARTGTVTTWTDSHVSEGPQYSYTVEAIGGGDRTAATPCSPSTITVGGGGAGPLVPASCAVELDLGGVRVSWTNAAGNESDAIIIYRSRNGGQLFWAGRATAPASEWLDANVTSGFNYHYEVRSRLGTTFSDPRGCTPNQISP